MQLVFKKSLDEILKGCLNNDRSSQKKLFDLYAPKMLAVCMRYIRNKEEAEDVLQESFIKVYKKLDTFKGNGSFEGWIRSIMVNTSLRHLENRKREIDKTELTNYTPIPGINDIISKLDYQILIKLVNELPDGYRLVFTLYAIEGFQHKEIAEKLGITVGTSKSQLARARDLLKKNVEKYYMTRHILKRG